MPPEGSTRPGILLSCPSLDWGSREAEIGFQLRTFRPHTPTISRKHHGRTWAGILSGHPHPEGRTIKVLSLSLWLKSLTARHLYSIQMHYRFYGTGHHMFQPPTGRARRLCSSDL
ncbi:hypothetical protein T265_06779 [Opisthorchis viverrini]|uniref:Uncharacterized protein n=1 Tax=Opisthorchis viverrini TaxID=6198 RepID=A0A074ZFA5_OPIVI|nr:hypothetical protein T265_06779 [Opisthorchis viverrini]KER25868.1 hypothetical protein T265_06779 [Opisthorchis viverrini]